MCRSIWSFANSVKPTQYINGGTRNSKIVTLLHITAPPSAGALLPCLHLEVRMSHQIVLSTVPLVYLFTAYFFLLTPFAHLSSSSLNVLFFFLVFCNYKTKAPKLGFELRFLSFVFSLCKRLWTIWMILIGNDFIYLLFLFFFVCVCVGMILIIRRNPRSLQFW